MKTLDPLTKEKRDIYSFVSVCKNKEQNLIADTKRRRILNRGFTLRCH